jgi:hypothetical protein
LAQGTDGKSFKRPMNLDMPVGVDLGMKYVPRGIRLTNDSEGYRIHYKLPTGAVCLRQTRPLAAVKQLSATRSTLQARMSDAITVLRETVDDFDSQNTRYQRLMDDYMVACRMVV